MFQEGDALLVVDPQVDFCPGGALPVPAGDAIFGSVNQAARGFGHVVASQDWHPAGHISFAERGGPWPAHCVAGTGGAAFHPALDSSLVERAFRKGTDPDAEAYSAFQGTGLARWLQARGVRRLFVAGLATDYCVASSVLDARRLGFQVVVLEDAVAAVNVCPGDGARALERMRAAGAAIGQAGAPVS